MSQDSKTLHYLDEQLMFFCPLVLTGFVECEPGGGGLNLLEAGRQRVVK